MDMSMFVLLNYIRGLQTGFLAAHIM